jgi:alpha-L-fucosidase
MKQLILLFTVLLMTQASAADGLIQDDEGMLVAKAKELTKQYGKELGLDTNMTAQFEEIVLGYMTRKAKAEKLNVSESDKKVMLKQLSMQENEDMTALLSKGQYKKYLKAKIKLQP